MNAAELLVLLGFASVIATASHIYDAGRDVGCEPTALALSLASGKGFSLFGPSAHCAPAMPFVLAIVAWFAGDGVRFTLAAVVIEVVLNVIAVLLLPAVSQRYFGSKAPGFVGAAVLVAILAAVPATFGWEAPAAAVLFELSALAPATWIVLGPLVGVAALLSPPVALCIAVMSFRGNRDWVIAMILGAAFCMPWVARNYLVFGRFVPIRDNFGVELRVAYNDIAQPAFANNTPSNRMYHPVMSGSARRLVAELGEAEYYSQAGRDAVRWIALNPKHAFALTAKRVELYWLPPGEFLLSLTTVVSAFGLFLVSGTGFARTSIALFAVFPVPYYVAQSIVRYRQPTLWATALLVGFVAVLFYRKLESLAAPAGVRLPDHATAD